MSLGHVWFLRGVGNSLTPPSDRVGNSLLDASATMAKVEVELHPAVAVAIGLVAFPSIILSVVGCVVGWKRWCYTEGESGAMRPGAYVL